MTHHRPWTSRLGIAVGLASIAGVVLQPGFTATARTSSFTGTPQSPITHAIILLKENRSFDQYFGTFPGANGATTGQTHDGTTVSLVPPVEPLPQDIGHGQADWTNAYNGGAMNGFDLESNAISKGGVLLPYTSMTESQIPNYWAYARTYGLGDDMFADFKGSSFGNNLFMATAQSGRYDPALNYHAVVSNPSSVSQPSLHRWGCDDPSDTFVTTQAADGSKGNVYPCFQFSALANILSQYSVTWKFYADPGDAAFAHNALDAISSIRYNPSLWQNVVPLTQFNTDAANGTLASVSFVLTNNSEHPPQTACDGENESTTDINSVMSGPLWSSSAIFIAWDEWGGFYDHVSPPQVDDISYGFRVPLLVVSPWTKYGAGSGGGYVSHAFYSHASFLRWVEDNWQLPSLNPRDAGANGFSDFFDFTQTPKSPLTLSLHTCPALSPQLRELIATEDPD